MVSSPGEVIAQHQPAPSVEAEMLEWQGEPVTGEGIDPRDAGDGDWL